VLKDRGGEETAVRCEAGAQGASAAIPAGIAPGIYALLSGGEKVADVVARTDPAESDLKKLSSEEIRAIAASGGEARGLSWGAPENRQGGVAPAAAIIIVFAVLCLAFEMWMTRKR
jgi:hypothetical protein